MLVVFSSDGYDMHKFYLTQHYEKLRLPVFDYSDVVKDLLSPRSREEIQRMRKMYLAT